MSSWQLIDWHFLFLRWAHSWILYLLRFFWRAKSLSYVETPIFILFISKGSLTPETSTVHLHCAYQNLGVYYFFRLWVALLRRSFWTSRGKLILVRYRFVPSLQPRHCYVSSIRNCLCNTLTAPQKLNFFQNKNIILLCQMYAFFWGKMKNVNSQPKQIWNLRIFLCLSDLDLWDQRSSKLQILCPYIWISRL
jgi:hypothetical protein